MTLLLSLISLVAWCWISPVSCVDGLVELAKAWLDPSPAMMRIVNAATSAGHTLWGRNRSRRFLILGFGVFMGSLPFNAQRLRSAGEYSFHEAVVCKVARFSTNTSEMQRPTNRSWTPYRDIFVHQHDFPPIVVSYRSIGGITSWPKSVATPTTGTAVSPLRSGLLLTDRLAHKNNRCISVSPCIIEIRRVTRVMCIKWLRPIYCATKNIIIIGRAEHRCGLT